jgi:hypothetical protein
MKEKSVSDKQMMAKDYKAGAGMNQARYLYRR